jgi:serine protease Do
MVLVCIAAAVASAFPAKEVYQSTSDAVVLIISGSGKKAELVGAGSIVTRDGYVVTNAHVVLNPETKKPYEVVRVYLKPAEVTGSFSTDLVNKHEAEVVAFDEQMDLALLRVPTLGRVDRIISLADPSQIMVGEEVVAIGHPEQGGLWSLTYGRISGQIANQEHIQGKNVFQTDTSVNRGNSGGPLLDRRGYLVGVNTNIARTGSGGLAITGVNFALKASVVKTWLANRHLLTLAYGSESLEEPQAAQVAPQPMQPVQPQPMQPAPQPMQPAPQPMQPAPQPMQPMQPAPQPMQPAPEPQAVQPAPQPVQPQQPQVQQPQQQMQSDTILTPKRPYSRQELLEQVARELEDMMDEMRPGRRPSF